MYNIDTKLKTKAINLRNEGLSYGEIKKEVNVSKSTLSLWLKNIPLQLKHKKRLYTKTILSLSRGPKSQRERRVKEIAQIIKKASEEITSPISSETYKLLGAALYWAEGSKTTGFKITNSDPNFILLMTIWLEKVFGVSPKFLKAWLNIYPQQNELKLKQFWSQLTGIPFENFGKSFVKPLNKRFKKNNLYFGTISINVPKGTNMRYRIFGWIKGILKDIAPKTELVQREWKSFKETPKPVNIF